MYTGMTFFILKRLTSDSQFTLPPKVDWSSASFSKHVDSPSKTHHFLVSWLPSHPLHDCRGKHRSHWQRMPRSHGSLLRTRRGGTAALRERMGTSTQSTPPTPDTGASPTGAHTYVTGDSPDWTARKAPPCRAWVTAGRRSRLCSDLDLAGRPELSPPWSLHWTRWPRGPHGTVTLLPQNGH